ncbi:MAG: transcriptional repressor [Clostridia bacterium]|nr:transcriptional repressor [Clostridia bacterium]
MRTKGGYKTRQRDIILELLKNNTDTHLSSDEICEMLRSSGERVGATTVYRYLEKLYSEGTVQKYVTDRARYTYTEKHCREHFHLKCTECGSLFCADCDFLSQLCNHVKGDHGFTVIPSKTVFYGVCHSCAEKSNAQ